MNNVILRKQTVTDTYQPLAGARVVGSFCISASPDNSGNVQFLGDTGDDVPWVPGEWHLFKRVNLADIQVKGVPGDQLTIVGGTW